MKERNWDGEVERACLPFTMETIATTLLIVFDRKRATIVFAVFTIVSLEDYLDLAHSRALTIDD